MDFQSAQGAPVHESLGQTLLIGTARQASALWLWHREGATHLGIAAKPRIKQKEPQAASSKPPRQRTTYAEILRHRRKPEHLAWALADLYTRACTFSASSLRKYSCPCKGRSKMEPVRAENPLRNVMAASGSSGSRHNFAVLLESRQFPAEVCGLFS